MVVAIPRSTSWRLLDYERYLVASASSIALVSSFDPGSTGASKRASTLPLRSTRYLVKFHGISPPVFGLTVLSVRN